MLKALVCAPERLLQESVQHLRLLLGGLDG
jgi:hypothetical protein